MSKHTVLITKLFKTSELDVWNLVVQLDNENNFLVPIRQGGSVQIGDNLINLPQFIDNKVTQYPFEYSMLKISSIEAREAEIEIIGDKTTYIDIPLTTVKYIIKNIVQTNWVSQIDSINNLTDLKVGYTLESINASAVVHLDEYEVSSLDDNMHRFWLFFERDKIKPLAGNTFEGYITGYAWPKGLFVPANYKGFSFKHNDKPIKIQYAGVDSILSQIPNNDQQIVEKYQLPYNALEKIEKEAKDFSYLLLLHSPIVAVSLQYNIKDMSFKISEETNALEGFVYSMEYDTAIQTLNAFESGNVKGSLINKEILMPLYSKYKELLLEYKNSQPMPLTLYNGDKQNHKHDALDIESWNNDLNIGINPIQYSQQTATLASKPLNTMEYDEVTDEVAQAIANQARRKIKQYELSGDIDNTIETVINEPLTDTTPAMNKITRVDFDDSELKINEQQYINNDNNIPAFDDRLFMGHIYKNVMTGREELPYDYRNKVRIGDVFLPIPPTAIRMDKQYQTKKLDVMRSKTSLQTGVGNVRNVLHLDIYYANLEDVNGIETTRYSYKRNDGSLAPYYMDGLRPLIAQFQKAPFLPIDNEYINVSLGIENVVLRNIQVQTVQGFPEALKTTLILEEFDLEPYIIGETQLGALINYPLLRYHYQRSLHQVYTQDESEPYKTYLPPITELTNDFTLYLIDESDLLARNSLSQTIRNMMSPTNYRIKRFKEASGQVALDENGNIVEVTDENREALKDSIVDLANSSDKLNDLEEDYKAIKRMREQALILLNESRTKEEAIKFGLEDKYNSPMHIPVIVGGLRNASWEKVTTQDGTPVISDADVKYGHRMACLMYGRDLTKSDYIIEMSKVPHYNESTFVPTYALRPEFDKDRDYANDSVEGYPDKMPKEFNFASNVNYEWLREHYRGDERRQALFEYAIENNIPGYYFFKPKNDKILRQIASAPNIPNKYVNPYQGYTGFIFEAGNPEHERMLSSFILEFEKIEKDVDNYTNEYNKMLNELNKTEESLEMVPYYIHDIIPISLTVAMENNFSNIQVQAAETPTMQYFGSSAPEVMLTFETNDAGVQQVEALFRKIGRYVKEYREGLVTGFMRIENPLVNMFGIKDIIPANIQYTTMENFPDRRIVTITATAFNKTQRRQESIYAATIRGENDSMKDRAYKDGYNPAVDRQYVHKYLAETEIYPDLEMPKVEELNEALPSLRAGLTKWNNRTKQTFLDPDFYVATNLTMKKIVNDTLYGDGDHEVRLEDTVGYVTDASLKEQTVTRFASSGKSAETFEEEAGAIPYADPTLKWENYGNEQKFKPVIIGVTHGNLNGSAGGTTGVSNPPDAYSGSGRASADIPQGLTDLKIETHILQNNGIQTGGKGNTLEGITLHDTGAPNKGANARMHHNYQAGGVDGRQASWHYQVDDTMAIQSWEHSERCYHAGDALKPGGGNAATIGIEMCINSDGNFDKSVYNTALLMASLCFVYGWNPLTNIRTHQDCSGKYCPKTLLDRKNGWSVQEVYQLTNDLLNEIKAKNGQGVVTTETAKYVKNSKPVPSYEKWVRWSGNENKTHEDYAVWYKNTLNNNVNQELVWYKTADFIMQYFGQDFLSAPSEFHHIRNRSVPFKNTTGKTNLEAHYLMNTDLGVLTYASSDTLYAIRIDYNLQMPHPNPEVSSKINTPKLLNNGRENRRAEEVENLTQSHRVNNTTETDSFQRIMLYIKQIINYESSGLFTIKGQPILKEKNDDGIETKGGFAGAKLTNNLSVDEVERLLWDWEYNLETVIKEMATVYRKAKQNYYKEIRISAIEWAITSRSWVPLPEIIDEANYASIIASDNVLEPTEINKERFAQYDGPESYNGGKIDPTLNIYFQNIERAFQSDYTYLVSQESIGMLYTDLTGRIMPNIHLMYKGLENKEKIKDSDFGKYLFDPGETSFLPKSNHNRQEELRTFLTDEAKKEAAKRSDLNTPELVDKFIKEYVQYGMRFAETMMPIEEVKKTVTDRYKDGFLGLTGDTVEETDIVSDIERANNDTDIATTGRTISKHYSPWSIKESIYNMYVDTLAYDQTGRLLRAFPAFIVQLVDEGKWYGGFKTWDNFYGYNSINSIDVYKSRKIVADTAVVTMSNMYGGLTSKSDEMGYDELNRPSFFSSTFWSNYVFGEANEEVFDQRQSLSNTMDLRAGARLHIRMGYGANPFGLPIVFNGVISEVNTGEVVTIMCQGDGIELTNSLGGDSEDTNKTMWRNVIGPRDFIGKIMTSKGNWLKDIINKVSDAYFFKTAPSGIAHFGSDIYSEEGNISWFNDDYGEALMNVYTNDGLGRKSKYHDDEGHKISVIDSFLDDEGYAPLDVLFKNGGAFDSDDVLVSIYGQSIWDIIGTFTMTSPDYHATVVPFEYRSTLFFGKLYWPLVYAYDTIYQHDSATGEWIREVKNNGHKMKTLMQAHFVNSSYNLITNDIKASAEGVYNNVTVAYDGHSTSLIQADSDIRYDAQRTAHINADMLTRHDLSTTLLGFSGVRNFFTTEPQANIYGHSVLRDFMKDIYKGNYTMLAEASIKPYDLMYMSDTIQGFDGIHAVKAVHHSMSMETGFITIVEPDAYVVNFDNEGIYVAEMAWAIGKTATGRLGLSIGRPSTLETLNGTRSDNLSTSVMSKLVEIVSNKHLPEFSFANKLPNSYLAALMRKTYGLLFKEIGYQLSDPTILKHANTIMDTTKELRVTTPFELENYLKGYNESRYSPGIRRHISEQKNRLEAMKKFKYNQKQHFVGLDYDVTVQELVKKAQEASEDFHSYWVNYKNIEEAEFLSIEEYNRIMYDNMNNTNPLDSDRLTPEQLEAMNNAGPIGKSSFSAETPRKYFVVADVVGKTITNWVSAIVYLPSNILNIGVSAIAQIWDAKKQNSEAVKVIPMNYKGTEFLAAMEGHRGGVWGDAPSEWDKWFNLEFGDGNGYQTSGLLSRTLNSLSDSDIIYNPYND